jgi:hypothetical protein
MNVSIDSRVRAASSITLAVLFALSAQQLWAKPRDGKVTGRLNDSWCKTGIPRAAITIKGTKIKRKLKSDSAGRFEISVPPGTYQLTVEMYGYKRYIVNELKVTSGENSTVNLDMEPGWATSDPNAGKREPCRATEQIVGPERRLRGLHHHRSGEP